MFGADSGMYRCGNAMMVGVEGRNPDGSIDFDFYRRRAIKLRRERKRALLRGADRFVRPLLAVAMVAAAILAMPARDRQTPHQAEVAGSGWTLFAQAVR